jgi:hypothetical protein
MQVYLNGEKADITLEDEKTVGQVAQGLDAWLSGQGLVLKGLAIDCQTIDISGIEEAFRRPLEGIESLDFAIAPYQDMEAEALQELTALKEKLPAIAESLEDLPLALQTGRDKEAAGSIAAFSLAAEKLLSLLPYLKNSGKALPLERFSGDFHDKLKEFLAACEAEDTILMGDLAEYELAPLLKTLAEEIE